MKLKKQPIFLEITKKSTFYKRNSIFDKKDAKIKPSLKKRGD